MATASPRAAAARLCFTADRAHASTSRVAHAAADRPTGASESVAGQSGWALWLLPTPTCTLSTRSLKDAASPAATHATVRGVHISTR
eukprot:CAMPEP_0177668584 /NCGR_PEP_ID=MMETSP0447-20121125/22869_1 /TAXON_ID=0 /ORGANISM="Stygamoeba regulata, Strain BSH-02190019" /LENGTH=86 /DNA_ID=CAMNT_0019175161 /DNA_START=18 /DNA_END=274 /DNA_ORIENTATION=+